MIMILPKKKQREIDMTVIRYVAMAGKAVINAIDSTNGCKGWLRGDGARVFT